MNKNIISGTVVLIFAIVYTVLSFRLPEPSANATVGPSIFPGTIGILLVLTSVLLIINGIVELRKNPKKQEVQNSSEEEEEQDNKKVFLILLILLAYLVLFFPLGYVISTFLFIFGLTTLLDRKHWIRNLIYAITFPVTVYLLFDKVLSVYLPLGPLG